MERLLLHGAPAPSWSACSGDLGERSLLATCSPTQTSAQAELELQ
ncbi:hypothetical protein BVRB_3g069160 [Beta vulgaris subsp. vulgaris]|nr:hypothetical protein BVRB_3g069160 [Beta vulgaris subsp. vulgaris]